MTQNVRCLIKFVDPQLKRDEVVTEVHYLIDDLCDLEGMGQTRFEKVSEIREADPISVGVKFETDAERLGAILRRLRDRLYYRPIDTLFFFQASDLNLQIQTHRAEDLLGLLDIARSGLLFSPACDYLAEAETYSRTQGELSPTELDNLNLIRQRLGLSVEQADDLNAKATGPYRTQAEKRRHFEDITQAEFSRLRTLAAGQPLAPKDTWSVLQELAENLGLPIPTAEAIYQQHQQRYDDDNLNLLQFASGPAEVADLGAATPTEIESQTQAQADLDQYRSLCRQTMAEALYPSEFDQGRLAQARRLHTISLEEASTIEAAVRDELYGSIESATGVDYNRLRELLHQQAWPAADLETEVVMLKALNHDMQPVTAATVQRLSPVDLATIDALWSRYSNGRFGFKAQQQVYRSQQPLQSDDHQRWAVFEETLGWREPSSWLYQGFKPYYNLTFSLEAPPGHLPTWRWCCVSLGHRYSPSPEAMEAVMAYLNDCMPLESAMTALDPTAIAGEVNHAS